LSINMELVKYALPGSSFSFPSPSLPPLNLRRRYSVEDVIVGFFGYQIRRHSFPLFFSTLFPQRPRERGKERTREIRALVLLPPFFFFHGRCHLPQDCKTGTLPPHSKSGSMNSSFPSPWFPFPPPSLLGALNRELCDWGLFFEHPRITSIVSASFPFLSSIPRCREKGNTFRAGFFFFLSSFFPASPQTRM